MCVYSRLDRKLNVWIFDDEVDDLESMRYWFANETIENMRERFH